MIKSSCLTLIFTAIFWFSSTAVGDAYAINGKTWNYKGFNIGYDEAVSLKENIRDDEKEIPILLLNGFGVGSFHQHRLMPHLVLSSSNQKRKVYGIDYMGQGKSWPINCDDGNSENERNLIYSIDTWADQIIDFVQEVLVPIHGEDVKVHLIGNSVGGHLAALLATKRPDLIESVCLLNATPVWGLNLPFWSGHLPPPFLPRRIGRFLFDQIRNLGTIEKYLEAAYFNKDAYDETLIKQIRSCTDGKGGHAAFASIMWSPPASFPSDAVKDFYSNLSKIQCDVLLIFGKDDPWCTPSFAKRMLQSLKSREAEGDVSREHVHRYIELERVGHCPNH